MIKKWKNRMMKKYICVGIGVKKHKCVTLLK